MRMIQLICIALLIPCLGISQLIDKIYIHPKSENWYKNLVIELVSKLGFDITIEKSDLESDILI